MVQLRGMCITFSSCAAVYSIPAISSILDSRWKQTLDILHIGHDEQEPDLVEAIGAHWGVFFKWNDDWSYLEVRLTVTGGLKIKK